MADNGVGTNLPFLDQKMEIRERALSYRLMRLDE
jgi:hypothetical protein